MGIPRVDLASYAPDDEALALVPAAVARFRGVLPLFEIEGMLTVAIGDPIDIFTLDELAVDLSLEVEPVLADGVDVHAAIRQYYGEGVAVEVTDADTVIVGRPVARRDRDLGGGLLRGRRGGRRAVGRAHRRPRSRPSPSSTMQSQSVQEVVEAAAPAGPSGIDLDVLAVADDRKVAVLVADMLEQAVARGANRIHVFPYKNDFFLVYRIKGRLEKIASAPLSMQGPLIEGFKSWAKLGHVPSDVPALGRLARRDRRASARATVSSVPTVAGQRLVVSLSPRATRAAQPARARHDRRRVARAAGDGRARSRHAARCRAGRRRSLEHLLLAASPRGRLGPHGLLGRALDRVRDSRPSRRCS